jgi:hypothetical protein
VQLCAEPNTKGIQNQQAEPKPMWNGSPEGYRSNRAENFTKDNQTKSGIAGAISGDHCAEKTAEEGVERIGKQTGGEIIAGRQAMDRNPGTAMAHAESVNTTKMPMET